MSKRTAGKQLTLENYEEEEEAEEAGVFVRASEDTMKERKIRVAKRRGISSQSDGEAGGAFKGFKGFSGFGASNSSMSSTAFTGFGGLKSDTPSSVSNGTSSTTISSTTKFPEFKPQIVKTQEPDMQKPDSSNEKLEKSKYFTQLKALNENVAAWIKKHVDSNPYCILTPIFKDYEKHLAAIEKIDKDSIKSATAPPKVEEKLDSQVTSSGGFIPSKVTESSSAKGSMPVFSFSATLSEKDGKAAAPSSTTDTKESDRSTSGFKFASSSTTSAAGFQFGSGSSALKPFTFAMGAASTADSKKPEGQAKDEEEEYVPPKPEVKEIKEDAVYSKRCKLFYQKETAEGTKEWAEKGIGNLHLKEVEGGKTQLLIRADTNLGNVLLNILLTDSIPLNRTGKNNVNLVCIPSPPVDPKLDSSKPVMMLLRVKTSEDADELYEKLTELKKGK